MEELKWKYYNHALLPTTAPHEKVDENIVKSGILWKKKWGGVPLLIRWTTDFDCQEETEWWYCIKDTPFDTNILKSKRRYEINKGKKNFEVKEINLDKYAEDIIKTQILAWNNYPLEYRPNTDYKNLKIKIKDMKQYKIFGAFNRKDNQFCGFALIKEHKNWVNFVNLKVQPKYEKLGINAAIVVNICEYYNEKLNKDFYISDGERNIVHMTLFQDYLIKYFGFRKAYCKLKIQYVFWIKIIINILYPLRKIIKTMNNHNTLLYKISALLYMEELKRKSK